MRFSARPSAGTQSGQDFAASTTVGSASSSARTGASAVQRFSRSGSDAKSSRVFETNRSNAFWVLVSITMASLLIVVCTIRLTWVRCTLGAH